MANNRTSPGADATPDEPPPSERLAAAAQHDFVAARRPDPARPPEATLELSGLLGDSDRPGFRRLYFSRKLDRYAEFRTEDVLDIAEVPADEPPIRGLTATTVILRRDAPVEFTHLRVARPVDEFDLDVRLAARAAPIDDDPFPGSHPFGGCTGGGTIGEPTGGGGTIFETATRDSCGLCDTDFPLPQTNRGVVCLTDTRRTCESVHVACATSTCHTRCNQFTCGGTCNTCLTRCGQATCNGTCNATCRTCETNCGTCRTCDTCNRHIPACGMGF